MTDYRLHPIIWKNVIDYNWLRLQITNTPCLGSSTLDFLPITKSENFVRNHQMIIHVKFVFNKV